MRRATMNNSVENLEAAAAAWVFRRGAGLTSEEQAAFERWRATDPQHAAVLARHERAWSALDRPRQAGQADFVLEKLAERASRRRRRRAGVIGATCALLIAGMTFWHARHSPSALPDSRALVVLPETQTLPDGSIIEMKSGAEITVDFGGPLRRVALKRGEAHFQVAHQSRPFVVTAGNVEFRAVGTAFCVQLAGAQVELLVTEGRVAVTQIATVRPGSAATSPFPSAPALMEPVYVVAGRHVVMPSNLLLSVAPETKPMAAEEIATALAWRGKRIEFTRTPLPKVAELFNRQNRLQLSIGDLATGDLRGT